MDPYARQQAPAPDSTGGRPNLKLESTTGATPVNTNSPQTNHPQINPNPNPPVKAPPKYYLTKVPEFLYEALTQISDAAPKNQEKKEQVGGISPIVTKSKKEGGQEFQLKFDFPESIAQNNFPLEYRLKLTPMLASPNLHSTELFQQIELISQSKEEEGDFTVSIREKGDITPVVNSRFTKYVAARAKESNTPKRKIGVGDLQTSKIGVLQPIAAHPDRVKKQKVAPPERNERIPKEQLFERLFGLFAEKDAYTLKELVSLTHQSAQYVREVASEIATQGKDGFQLKPELKTESQKDQTD